MQGPKVSLAVAAKACTGVRKEASLACAMRPSQGQLHKSEGATRSLSLLMTHDHKGMISSFHFAYYISTMPGSGILPAFPRKVD